MQNQATQSFLTTELLTRTGPLLCLDIGSGTQDVLLALPDQTPENWPSFVLPAPARRIAARIRELTALGKPIWLYGGNMGGGFAGAVFKHLEQGLPLAVTPEAGAAINDRPQFLEQRGIKISALRPEGHVPVRLADYDPGFWNSLWDFLGLPLPQAIAAAVQDHGVHADCGNREGRFNLWRQWLAQTQNPVDWLFADPPQVCTRLASLSKDAGGAIVADTGVAAVLGALSLPEVRERSWREGVTIVNLGNSHTLAFLVWQEKILGIYEHHTGLLNRNKLLTDLKNFRMGWLPDEQVRADNGHGCVLLDLPPEAESFIPTYILGPQRAMLEGQGVMIAPAGNMMLAGCHGLLYGLAKRSTV